jgi:hypothetical protein
MELIDVGAPSVQRGTNQIAIFGPSMTRASAVWVPNLQPDSALASCPIMPRRDQLAPASVRGRVWLHLSLNMTGSNMEMTPMRSFHTLYFACVVLNHHYL